MAFNRNLWSQSLLGLGSGLLSASGPSSTPVSTGQALSQGLLSMSGAMQSAQAQQASNKDARLDRRIKRTQLKSYQQEAEDAKAAQRERERLGKRLPSLLDEAGLEGPERLVARSAYESGDTASLLDMISPEEADLTTAQRNLIAAGFDPKARPKQFQHAMRADMGLLDTQEAPDYSAADMVTVQTPQGPMTMPATVAAERYPQGYRSPQEQGDRPEPTELYQNLLDAGYKPDTRQWNQAARQNLGLLGDPPDPNDDPLVDVQTEQGLVQMPRSQALEQYPQGIPQPSDQPERQTPELTTAWVGGKEVQMPVNRAVQQFPNGIPQPPDAQSQPSSEWERLTANFPPAMQKKLDLARARHEAGIEGPESQDQLEGVRYALALGAKRGTPRFAKLVRQFGPGGVTINNNEGAEPLSVSELKDIRKPDGGTYPVGTTPAQVNRTGGTIVDPVSGTDARSIASIGRAEDIAARLRELTSGPNAIETGPIAGRILGASTTTGIGLDKREAEFTALIEPLSNMVLQASRGASVGPEEQAKFEKQLPRPNDPPELFRQKLDQTIENLSYLNSKSSELMGAPTGDDAAPAPTRANARQLDSGAIKKMSDEELLKALGG